MGDMILALVSIVSGLGAAAALGMAFRHHWLLLTHDQQSPPEIERPE